MNIPRKWEHIANECKRLGYPESAKIARKIDRILVKFYKRKYTYYWKYHWKEYPEEMKINSKEEFFVLAENNFYCVACDFEINCYECKFGEKTGECDWKGSLWKSFMSTLKKEKRVK